MKLEIASMLDATSFEKIDGNSFAHSWNRKQFQDELKTESRIYYKISTNENDVIGYVGFNYIFDEADVIRIAVDKKYRSKGYGKQLFQYALNELKKRNINKIMLEVNEENGSAIKLYEKCEFTKISTRKRYYDNTYDAFIYELRF